MKKYTKAAITPLFLLLIGITPTPSIACELHDSGFLQNSLGKFHLPPTGAKVADLLRVYGPPMRRLNGPQGQHLWDYGSFKVTVVDGTVTFAGMWKAKPHAFE